MHLFIVIKEPFTENDPVHQLCAHTPTNLNTKDNDLIKHQY